MVQPHIEYTVPPPLTSGDLDKLHQIRSYPANDVHLAGAAKERYLLYAYAKAPSSEPSFVVLPKGPKRHLQLLLLQVN